MYIQYNGEFNYWLFCKFCRNWNLKQENVVECRICSGNLFHFLCSLCNGGELRQDTHFYSLIHLFIYFF